MCSRLASFHDRDSGADRLNFEIPILISSSSFHTTFLMYHLCGLLNRSAFPTISTIALVLESLLIIARNGQTGKHQPFKKSLRILDNSSWRRLRRFRLLLIRQPHRGLSPAVLLLSRFVARRLLMGMILSAGLQAPMFRHT